jgi:hypothetical protein
MTAEATPQATRQAMTERPHPPGRLFHGPETPQPQRRAVAERLFADHPEVFGKADDAAGLLRSIHLPASLRWAFLNNGKAGTSSARRFLFQMEFGVPLTVAWDVPHDINPDGVVHSLQGPAGIFRPAIALPAPLAGLEGALRLATVRHPVSRAISAFEYICKSHDLRHSWFAQDRLRMNAMVGFDWTADTRTARGFLRFLDYIAQMQAEVGRFEVNPHWRPQIDNVVPSVFRPQLIGRLEDMGAFYRAVAEHLGQPLPPGFDVPAANRQTYAGDRSIWLTPEARDRIAALYAADFDWLDYDPGRPE